MPLISTRGAASAQGFGEFAQSAAPVYIEDVFSTYLYTGNGSSQTITNGIDLSTKGGLVWTKIRSAADRNALIDSARGINKLLNSDATFAQATQNNMITALTTTGYTLGTDGTGQTNLNTATYASWTFRKQAKFFDVVTWTGNGTGNRTISHNLGSVPGCIITKKTSATGNWFTFHRSINAGRYGTQYLNAATTAATTTSYDWNPTATTFEADDDLSLNDNAATYVAYLFAHDAGGFGLSGTDNVISCGSYTGNGSATGPTVTLGYEPQWLLIKYMNGPNDGSGDGSWQIIDNMRGMVVGGTDATLQANSSAAETSNDFISPTATGFQVTSASLEVNVSGKTYIYIAIRRGPMKVPTSGTSVFSPSVYTTAPASPLTVTTNFPVDLSISQDIAGSVSAVIDRLRSVSASSVKYLSTQNTSAEGSTTGISLQNNTAIVDSGFWAGFAYKPVYWNFRRAPGFFDIVCYTGTGANLTLNHNLGIPPELIIFKSRNTVINWRVAYGFAISTFGSLILNLDSAGPSNVAYGTTISAQPTATTFSVGSSTNVGASGGTYVAYLFATVAGVSKVGSYTGNGTTQTINCGFTAGARFVMIKRTDLQGDWYVWDSARGIVAGNDPYLRLNSTAAENTSTDSVDTDSTGFVVNELAATNINVSSATYIYFSVA